MPHYKLMYFDGRGRAEVARLMFEQCSIPYDDKRISYEDWPKVKTTLPFGQMPVLEVDGKMISQSKAIGRYLARQFGLCGKTDLDAAFCDALVDGIDDATNAMMPWFREKDPEKKKQLWKEFQDNHLKPFLEKYEKFLCDNGTGYFVGNQLTWADIAIFHTIQSYCSDLLGGHPKLQEFQNKIGNLPKIKAWIDRRPKTEF